MDAALRSSLAFRPQGGFRPPIVRTIANQGKGIRELNDAVEAHRAWASEPGIAETRRRKKVRARIRSAVREGIIDDWLARKGLEQHLDRATDSVLGGNVSPYRAAHDLIERMTRHGERAN